MNEKERKKSPQWMFYALAFGISWLLWIPTAISGQDFQNTIWLIPMLLGGFGPSLAGIHLTWWQGDEQVRRDFWHRLIDIKRISPGWYAFIFLVFPLTFILFFTVRSLLGYALPPFPTIRQIAANPLTLVGMILVGLIAGPLEEELGWRGYALERFQKHFSPLISSLILAPIWWVWHLPLFFIQGTRQSGWDLGSPEFWFFTAGIFPLSILLTWVYNCNNRSILAAVLLHFTYNFTMSLVLPLSMTANLFHLVLLCATAAGLVLGCEYPPAEDHQIVT
jgi:membrane protease YdiL (CAAX protease family)